MWHKNAITGLQTTENQTLVLPLAKKTLFLFSSEVLDTRISDKISPKSPFSATENHCFLSAQQYKHFFVPESKVWELH